MKAIGDSIGVPSFGKGEEVISTLGSGFEVVGLDGEAIECCVEGWLVGEGGYIAWVDGGWWWGEVGGVVGFGGGVECCGYDE